MPQHEVRVRMERYLIIAALVIGVGAVIIAQGMVTLSKEHLAAFQEELHGLRPNVPEGRQSDAAETAARLNDLRLQLRSAFEASQTPETPVSSPTLPVTP